ncbi:adenosylcobinamide kinase/adenosylcobinamide-phosphate guanylyltransferase [Fusobacterium necrophorum subsp. necrophorum]|nr:adenosylcobinamide kinase/adenosylcobinamide-phosphate guanylyltransferase [Fusobacterium necrophorum subsp. necrophorum]
MEEQEDWENISQERIQELEKYILEEISTFLEKIKKTSYDLVVVSNELGMGLVPPYPLGRYFGTFVVEPINWLQRKLRSLILLCQGQSYV